jgi:hypothetical protein
LTISVPEEESVQSLLSKIAEKDHTYEDSTINSKYLLYGGVPLQESKTLRDYNIRGESTLYATERIRGGCFAISITLWIIIIICCVISVFTCGLSIPVALCLLPLALILPLCCL